MPEAGKQERFPAGGAREKLAVRDKWHNEGCKLVRLGWSFYPNEVRCIYTALFSAN